EASAWLHVGNALVQDEREDEAVLVYETARQLYILARHASGQGLISQNLAEIARRKGDYSLGGKHLMDAAECFCRPEALEHLPRLIAYTNVFARFFDNKEIMDRMAALLTEHLTET